MPNAADLYPIRRSGQGKRSDPVGSHGLQYAAMVGDRRIASNTTTLQFQLSNRPKTPRNSQSITSPGLQARIAQQSHKGRGGSPPLPRAYRTTRSSHDSRISDSRRPSLLRSFFIALDAATSPWLT